MKITCSITASECPALSTLQNGTVNPANATTSNSDNGTVVLFECDDGFELVGDDTTTCLANSSWENTIPACSETWEDTTEASNSTEGGIFLFCRKIMISRLLLFLYTSMYFHTPPCFFDFCLFYPCISSIFRHIICIFVPWIQFLIRMIIDQ